MIWIALVAAGVVGFVCLWCLLQVAGAASPEVEFDDREEVGARCGDRTRDQRN